MPVVCYSFFPNVASCHGSTLSKCAKQSLEVSRLAYPLTLASIKADSHSDLGLVLIQIFKLIEGVEHASRATSCKEQDAIVSYSD